MGRAARASQGAGRARACGRRSAEIPPRPCARRGRELTLISTDVRNPSQPLTPKVLRTAAKLGRQTLPTWLWKYAKDKPIAKQLEEIKAELRDLAMLNQELGLTAGFQNHSGAEYVGAPVWTFGTSFTTSTRGRLASASTSVTPPLEGGYSWPNARPPHGAPTFAVIYVKDFFCRKGAKGLASRMVPLGEGMVNKTFSPR